MRRIALPIRHTRIVFRTSTTSTRRNDLIPILELYHFHRRSFVSLLHSVFLLNIDRLIYLCDAAMLLSRILCLCQARLNQSPAPLAFVGISMPRRSTMSRSARSRSRLIGAGIAFAGNQIFSRMPIHDLPCLGKAYFQRFC